MTDRHQHRDKGCKHALTGDLELCLDDGWHAGTAVNPDGSVWPWLICPDDIEPDTGSDRWWVWPSHELTGALPWSFQRKLRTYCEARTRSRRPCRVEVDEPGQRCRYHQPPPAAINLEEEPA